VSKFHLNSNDYSQCSLRPQVISILTAWLLLWGWLHFFSENDQDGRPSAWIAFYFACSAFFNNGLTLFSDSLMGYAREPFVLVVEGILILLGNTCFPIAFRAVLVWNKNRCVARSQQMDREMSEDAEMLEAARRRTAAAQKRRDGGAPEAGEKEETERDVNTEQVRKEVKEQQTSSLKKAGSKGAGPAGSKSGRRRASFYDGLEEVQALRGLLKKQVSFNQAPSHMGSQFSTSANLQKLRKFRALSRTAQRFAMSKSFSRHTRSSNASLGERKLRQLPTEMYSGTSCSGKQDRSSGMKDRNSTSSGSAFPSRKTGWMIMLVLPIIPITIIKAL
jgi:hypothetical protein